MSRAWIPALSTACLLAIPMAVAGSASPEGADGRLQVLAADPLPNYPPTSGPDDLAQLTDGDINRFPFWASPASVGWVNRTPVSLALEVPAAASGDFSLELRTGMQASADVYPPRWLDVYCQSAGASDWRHAASLAHQRTPAEDGQVVELRIAVRGCAASRVQLVIHADGPYLMLDQISLGVAGSPDTGAPSPAAGDAVTDPVTDSRVRLEAALQARARDLLRGQVRSAGPSGASAWLQPPWVSLDAGTPIGRDTRLARTALADGSVAYVLGLANDRPDSHRYTVRVPPSGPDAALVSRLRPVLAGDGRWVFDALVALPDGSLQLEPDSLAYVLVQQSRAPAGTSQVTVSDDTGWSQALDVEVSVLDRIRPGPGDRPRVLVWTYTNDEPIWQPGNGAAIAAQLADAGVNVFDLHPAHIPAPLQESAWDVRTRALAADLALFRGRGMVLLFVGTDAWTTLANLPDDGPTGQRLGKWVQLIARTLQGAGYGPGDWAFYLVDEPRGEDLARLAQVITRLRAIDPALRFYANPSLGAAEAAAAAPALWKLRGLVDYWQPRAGAGFDAVATLTGRGAPNLWMYDNPLEPAKSTAPSCYRALGRRSFAMGATGLGFWSFSNTNGSSAWSDFDGQQPDWAVVYEGGASYVPGRRWEAFQQGIGDFAALGYCAREQARDPVLRSQCEVARREIAADTAGACGN